MFLLHVAGFLELVGRLSSSGSGAVSFDCWEEGSWSHRLPPGFSAHVGLCPFVPGVFLFD